MGWRSSVVAQEVNGEGGIVVIAAEEAAEESFATAAEGSCAIAAAPAVE